MSCEQIVEILDAYALGAVEPEEAANVEGHVADCVECWNELGRAHEAAALLALSVPRLEAPALLGERIISTAQREATPVRAEKKPSLFERLGFGWPAAAGAMGVASVAAIVFGLSMQQQVNDLEDENAALNSELRASTFALEQDLANTEARVEEQEILLAVSSDDNAQELEVAPMSTNDNGAARYTYSADVRQGVVECYGMETLPPGMLYQVWVVNEDGTHPMATFQPQDGKCLVTMSLGYLDSPPTGIGVTVETIPGGLDGPSGEWALYSEIPQE